MDLHIEEKMPEKEDQSNVLYNVYIKVGGERQIRLALNSQDIVTIFDGIRSRKLHVIVGGRKTLIQYETFKIFDTSKALNRYDKGELKDEIDKTKLALNISMGLELLKLMGIEQTHKFDLPSPLIGPDLGSTKVLNPGDNQKNGKIFISHSSLDSDVVKAFCKHVLDLGLKIDLQNEVYNTSLVGSKPKTGEDFKKSIRDNLVNARMVLQFISINYKKSEICMNEMGAAWVLNSVVVPLVVEEGEYDVGFINSSKQQVQLLDSKKILEFIQDHKGILTSTEPNIPVLTESVEEFIIQAKQILDLQKRGLKEYNVQETKEISSQAVNVKPDPVEETTALFKEQQLAVFKRRKFFENPDSILMANKEIAIIFETVDKQKDKIEFPETDFVLDMTFEKNRMYELRHSNYCLRFHWTGRNTKNVADATLSVSVLKKDIPPPRESELYIVKGTFQFDMNPKGVLGWVYNGNKNDFYSTKEVIETWVKQFLLRYEESKSL